MVNITYMKWSNFFSYGEDNYLELNKENVTQLIAGNGAGKTSILLILEELLYGKNHKGVKKVDLVNRNIKSKTISGEVGFEKEGSTFVVSTTRSPGLKVALTKDGVDISKHTGVQTIKLVEEILGIPYSLFNQLTYLSTDSKINFLTDTDTGRKKFLVKLFQLDNYLEAHEIFKRASKNLDADIKQVSGSLDTLNKLIDKDSKLADTPEVRLYKVPDKLEFPNKASLESNLANIKKLNNKVQQNNKYKEMLESLDKSILAAPVEQPAKADMAKGEQELGGIKSSILAGKQLISKIRKLEDKCPTCYSKIDTSSTEQLVEESLAKIKKLQKEGAQLEELIKENKGALKKFKLYSETSVEFERLTNIIDDDLHELLDKDVVTAELTAINDKINERNTLISQIKRSNDSIIKDNYAISAAISNIAKYTAEAQEKTEELTKFKRELGLSTTLRDIFSTKGLISYKLQYLVLDLETQINSYLSELSKGQFLINFDLQDEKLNVVVVDNGNPITISSLSTGELGLVEVSTLLAVRKLMTSISGTSTNILFLDEVISVLEEDNKTAVLELLQKEHELNILVVSHGFEHPLLPKLGITKHKGISTLREV